MQEPRLTEVTLLYARGKNLSTGEFFWRFKRRQLAEDDYAVTGSQPEGPGEPRRRPVAGAFGADIDYAMLIKIYGEVWSKRKVRV